jgi:hypothetical protein
VVALVAIATPGLADCRSGSPAATSDPTVRCLTERLAEIEHQLEDAVLLFEAAVCPSGFIAYDPAHPLLPRPGPKAQPGQGPPHPLIFCRKIQAQ